MVGFSAAFPRYAPCVSWLSQGLMTIFVKMKNMGHLDMHLFVGRGPLVLVHLPGPMWQQVFAAAD